MRIIAFLSIVALLASCGEGSTNKSPETESKSPDSVSSETSEQTPPTTTDGEEKIYGENFEVSSPLSFAAASDSIMNTDSLVTQVSGTVNEVCQVKGCWLTMGEGENSMRVKFKDYGFFVPKDCAGKTAYLKGVMKKETVSVDEQKHYLEDAGASEEEIAAVTEDEVQLSFMADGVILK